MDTLTFQAGDRVRFKAYGSVGVTGTVTRNLGPDVNIRPYVDVIEWDLPGEGIVTHGANLLEESPEPPPERMPRVRWHPTTDGGGVVAVETRPDLWRLVDVKPPHYHHLYVSALDRDTHEVTGRGWVELVARVLPDGHDRGMEQ